MLILPLASWLRGRLAKGQAMRHLNVIGPVLVKLRVERGWTQEVLATRLQREGVDVSRQMLANMECGRTQITDKHLIGFQKVFRTCVIQLFPLDVQALDKLYAQREVEQLDGPRRRRQ